MVHVVPCRKFSTKLSRYISFLVARLLSLLFLFSLLSLLLHVFCRVFQKPCKKKMVMIFFKKLILTMFSSKYSSSYGAQARKNYRVTTCNVSPRHMVHSGVTCNARRSTWVVFISKPTVLFLLTKLFNWKLASKPDSMRRSITLASASACSCTPLAYTNCRLWAPGCRLLITLIPYGKRLTSSIIEIIRSWFITLPKGPDTVTSSKAAISKISFMKLTQRIYVINTANLYDPCYALLKRSLKSVLKQRIQIIYFLAWLVTHFALFIFSSMSFFILWLLLCSR